MCCLVDCTRHPHPKDIWPGGEVGVSLMVVMTMESCAHVPMGLGLCVMSTEQRRRWRRTRNRHQPLGF